MERIGNENRILDVDKMGEMDKTDKIDKVEETDKMDKIGEADKMDKIVNLKSKIFLYLCKIVKS